MTSSVDGESMIRPGESLMKMHSTDVLGQGLMSEEIREMRQPTVQTNWSQMVEVATGCSQDYISQHGHGHWIREAPGQVKGTDLKDPVQSLKDGVPVLLFEEDDHAFERRVLKADDELHFLYVLTSMQGKQGGIAPLMSVPLTHIRKVYVMDEALHICEEHGVTDSNLKLDSTIVVYYDMEVQQLKKDDLETEVPPLNKLFILMAAPQQRLQRMLESCMDMEKKSQAHRTIRNNALRIDAIELINNIYHRDTNTNLEFNMSFRNDNSTRKLTVGGEFIKYTDIQKEKFDGKQRDDLVLQLGKIEHHLQTEFRVLDVARVMYVLRDAAHLRRASAFLSPVIFNATLEEFVEDKDRITKVLPTDEAFRHAWLEVDTILDELNTGKAEDERYERIYTEASARAVLACTKQLLLLEAAHARVETELEELEIEVNEEPQEEVQTKTNSQGMLDMFTPSFDIRANVLGFGGTSSLGATTPLLNQGSSTSEATAQRSADARDKPAGGLGLQDDAQQDGTARSNISVERPAVRQEPETQADQRITKPQEDKKKEQSLPELRRRMRNADEKRTCEVPECTWQ